MGRVWQTIVAVVVQGPTDSEDLLRFRFYSVFVGIAIPVMLGFGIAGYLQHNYLLALLIFVSWIALITGWLRLRSGHDDRLVYRLNGLIFGLLIFYMIAMGGENGSKSLWFYTYPSIVLFILGEREGSAWAAGLLACVAAVLWVPMPGVAVYPYPDPFKIRLLTIYLILAIITLGFEYSRRRYRDAMWAKHQELKHETTLLLQQVREREKAEREKEALIHELQDTLAQVKTLKGLVPICAHCHCIRDDRGFWNQLESYLLEHSDAQFSHGICPACIRSLYPEIGPDTTVP